MSILRIQLLGVIQVDDTQYGAISLQPTVQTFLAYLVLNRDRSHCREVLSSLFWGEKEESHARRCLSTTLWRLRQELEPDNQQRGAYIKTSHSGEISFNCWSDRVWLDVATFEEEANHGLSCQPADMGAEQLAQLERAASLYRGDLLEGLYADWILQHREQLRGLYIRCLGRLMRYHKREGDYRQGIHYGQKILAIDPLREEVHREMMRLHHDSGNRPQAIQQYQSCRQILAQELDIQPMPETQALYNQLTTPQNQPITPAQDLIRKQPETLEQTLSQLDQALFSLEEVRGQLRHARDIITQYLNR